MGLGGVAVVGGLRRPHSGLSRWCSQETLCRHPHNVPVSELHTDPVDSRVMWWIADHRSVTGDFVAKKVMFYGTTPRFMVVGCVLALLVACLLYTSPSPRDRQKSRMPSSA